MANMRDESNPCGHEWPVGYLSVDAWIRDKLRTHRQKQCPKCGKWMIFEKKVAKNSK